MRVCHICRSTVYNNWMQKFLLTASASLLILALTTLAPAQEPRKSRHESTSIEVAGHKITITYGRPYLRGRKMIGDHEPYGKVWRTGADEATTLETDADLDINGLRVPKGTYGIFTIPNADKWTLLVSKNAKQWGAFSYKEAEDLGRTDMKVSKAGSTVEQFTMTLTQEGANGALLTLAWDKVEARVPIQVQ